MGTETSKIALNAHVHLRTANQQMSRPGRHVDDIIDMRRSCRLRENTSGRRPLGSSSRLLKVARLDFLGGGYLPSLSIDYVAMSKDREKRLPQLYYIKMKISYDLGFIAIGVAMAT